MATRFDRSSVLGVKEAIAAFRKAEPAFRARMNEATEDTAIALWKAEKTRVPVATGILGEHLAWTMSKATGRARVGIRPGAVLDNRNRLHRPTKYGHLAEFGHRTRSGGFVQGKPFAIPATEGQRQPYLERCRAAAQKAERDLAQQADLTIGGGRL